MSKPVHPPHFMIKFLRWFCHPDLVRPIEGDLMELYEERLETNSKRNADLHFMADVILLFRPNIIKPSDGTYRLNTFGMFKNYFKIGIRNLLKNKTFSFINIFGLAVAMSVCMLILSMLSDQKSHDQYNQNKDRVYRILSSKGTGQSLYATTPYPLTQTLLQDYPQLQTVTQLRDGIGGDVSSDQKTIEVRGFFADTQFFTIFDRELEQGDVHTALSQPRSIVLSAEKAYALFNTNDPIGRTVEFTDLGLDILNIGSATRQVDWGTFTVTGVINNRPIKSHLEFDVLVSSSMIKLLTKEEKLTDLERSWTNYFNTYTYVMLSENQSRQELDFVLNSISENAYSELAGFESFYMDSQSLNDITPSPLINNLPKPQLPDFCYYILGVLAAVVMIMACLNYTNLSIAKSLQRMKEIGIRKVTGARRKDLIFQFLTEAILTSILALILAYVALSFTKEAFLNLWANQYFNFDLTNTVQMHLQFLGFAVLIGVLAGLYPALVLSGNSVTKAFKNGKGLLNSKWGMQKLLNTSQLVISLLFIVTTTVIYQQFRHYLHFDYGFEQENIVNVSLQGNDHKMLTSAFESVAGVELIAACHYIPATSYTNIISFRKPEDEESSWNFKYLAASVEFPNVLNLSFIAGSNYRDTKNAYSSSYILINETASKQLGYSSPAEAIGQVIIGAAGNKQFEIMGVLKDFRSSNLLMNEKTTPLVLRNDAAAFNYLNVKVAGSNLTTTLSKLEEQWKSIDQKHPFKYEMMDQEVSESNAFILDIASIIGYLSFLAIGISCMGLLGMAIYSTERKTKEVGIRKVLGAAEMSIVYLLSREFLILLLIAVFIAAPLSFFVNNLWLENIANRVELTFGTIAISTAIMLSMGMVTIMSQTLRAARKNPADSLKTE